ncbi:MAG: ABC transporter ATP-binding protein, partial [Proteobacteria bacterium]
MEENLIQKEHLLTARDIRIDYLVIQHRYTSIKELLIAAVRGKLRKTDKFSAVKAVDFDLFRGETVGLIGRNGSGKSTLLKACADILSPSAGTINRFGTLTSLIELGAGFDGELSAEENVYLSCMLMGFDRELISKNLDRIFAFAELEKFRTFPVKTFSSGMHARLGFACATLIDADIILIDEVLAVGDEAFQLKCLKHMQNLKDAGRSIVFVSHDLGTVQTFCDRVYVLEAGEIIYQGDPKIAVERLRSVLLPERHKKNIGDLSEGLKIVFGGFANSEVNRSDFSFSFEIKKSLMQFSWKFQIFGFGQGKPLIIFRSSELDRLL